MQQRKGKCYLDVMMQLNIFNEDLYPSHTNRVEENVTFHSRIKQKDSSA